MMLAISAVMRLVQVHAKKLSYALVRNCGSFGNFHLNVVK